MNLRAPLLIAVALLGVAVGYLIDTPVPGSGPVEQAAQPGQQGAGQPSDAGHEGHDHVPGPLASSASEPAIYQCPMHPWIKSERDGERCTICGMSLVAAVGGTKGIPDDPGLVTLSASQRRVIGVQSEAVRRGVLTRTLRVSGAIDDDDTRHRILAARVPGRIERLEVNYLGAEVKAGAPLVTVFSPQMLTAQRQYLERINAGAIASSVSDRASARERLLELGLTEAEIRILEGTLKPTAMVSVRAPMTGTVVARSVYEGQYVETNDPLFEIGDFSRMWFVFDAYEPDLAWLRVGQQVELTVQSLPGQVLRALISFIDPNLDEVTHTARVRVVLENQERRLRHRQTAQAVVIGTWPDTLIAPRSAVLQHSGRSVVYLDRGDAGFAAQEVRLGRVGDQEVEVLGGVAEGDRVVTQSALLIDAQAQLAHAAVGGAVDAQGQAGPSRIEASVAPHDEAAYNQLRTLVFAAADAASALAADDLARYRRILPDLRSTLAAYIAGHPPAAREPVASHDQALSATEDLDVARRAFEPFSTALADLAQAEHLHHREDITIYQCPMTPVLGTARWLSRSKEVRNPFFGSTMLECGDALP